MECFCKCIKLWATYYYSRQCYYSSGVNKNHRFPFAKNLLKSKFVKSIIRVGSRKSEAKNFGLPTSDFQLISYKLNNNQT